MEDAARADRRRRCATATRARCATSRGWRSPPSARQGEGSGVIGVDVQRIRRALGLRAEPQPDLPPEDPRRDGLPRDELRRFEALLRRELERAQIERTEQLPPARPLDELDRALPSGPLQDLAAVHRVVAQLQAAAGDPGQRAARPQAPRARRRAHARCARRCRPAACRSSSSSDAGAPAAPGDLRAVRRLDERHQRVGLLPRRCCTRCTTRFARCARSCSSSASPRSPTSSTRSATSRRSARRSAATPASPTSPATPTTGACGRSSATQVEDDLHPRATVIVLGDARTNGRDPRADIFAQIAATAGRTFWLNPEPRLYWNYGDSVIAAYEQYCDGLRVLDDRSSSRTSSRR